MSYNVREHSYVVGGLGVTGQACVRFLLKHNANVKAFDTRQTVTLPDDIETALAGKVTTDTLDAAYFEGIDTLVLSPGLSLNLAQVKLAKQCGVEVIGDVELFARLNQTLSTPKRVMEVIEIQIHLQLSLFSNLELN